MRNYAAAGAALAAVLGTASADLCSIGSSEIGGNWYCQAVNAITYDNFGSSGSYNRVTSMDSTSGACSSAPQAYAGSLAPLNEEVSMHFRGPLALKQFAWYKPGGHHKRARRSAHAHAHAHAGFHAHQHEVREAQDRAEAEEKRDLWVTAVINGATVSWDWNAPAATGAAAAAAAPAPAAPAAPSADGNGSAKIAAPYHAAAPAAAGDWVRHAYYDSASQTSQGLTLLNNMGGQGSGVFDFVFGNSLSYSNADGSAGSASPQVLADTTLPSNTEVILMSDKPCTGTACGYYRDGTVAYHGFGGDKKLFVMEFSMPLDGETGFNGDMPSIWMLNAQIPRTLQYGSASCSCWESGCGEFDLFEVLSSGATQCKSTLHGNISGGDSDYFTRPTTGTMKAAVLMSSSQAHIKVLDDSFDFSKSLDPDFINSLASSTDDQSAGISLFTLG